MNKNENESSKVQVTQDKITPSLEIAIKKAIKILSHDGLVVYPTETVYGLGADALSEIAIYNVYDAKKRPMGKPISVAVSDIEMIHAIAYVDDVAEQFIQKFLPGPFTVILPVKQCLPPTLSGGTGTIGIRFPDNPIAQKLITDFDCPITATSANVSGAEPPITINQVNVPNDCLIDGGKLPGIPSTIVNISSKTIDRPGANIDEIAKFFKNN